MGIAKNLIWIVPSLIFLVSLWLFGRRYETFQKSVARVGSSYSGPINAGENVWAIRFTDSEGEVVPGTLRVHILVELAII